MRCICVCVCECVCSSFANWQLSEEEQDERQMQEGQREVNEMEETCVSSWHGTNSSRDNWTSLLGVFMFVSGKWRMLSGDKGTGE